MKRPSSGFSLVELMVALAVTGVLMAGLTQVFASTVSNLHASSDLNNAQRRNRWMMDRLSDDLKMAGHTDGMSVPLTDMQEPPFLVIPGGSAEQPLDTLQLFSNQPLEEGALTGTLAPGADTFSVTPDGSNELHVRQGDWFFMKDGERSEVGFVQAVLGTSITMMDSSQLQASHAGQVMDQGSGRMAFSHETGARVFFLRPLQLVRYSIQDQSVDPGNPDVKVPCLVRQETVYEGSSVNWSKVPTSVLATQAHALRVDLSADAGKTWVRSDAKTWAAMRDAVNAKLAASNTILDTELWFKRVPLLIRVDLTARTATSRTEFAAKAAETAFGLRTQTLMVAPRNFANPL